MRTFLKRLTQETDTSSAFQETDIRSVYKEVACFSLFVDITFKECRQLTDILQKWLEVFSLMDNNCFDFALVGALIMWLVFLHLVAATM